MGVSLHIQRVDGREGDLPIAEISDAITMFHAIPWEEEIAKWDRLPEEQREGHRPLFQLFDDSGHALHLTAHSKDFIALAYNFPLQASAFGWQDDEQGYLGTDQFPRGEFPSLIACFYASDTKAMLALLSRFPAVTREEEL